MSTPRKVSRAQENVFLQANQSSISAKTVSSSSTSSQVAVPPKPPRSAFTCFTDAKKDEILSRRGVKNQAELLKIVAGEWRDLSKEQLSFWDEEARDDKVRFVREKAEYTGPWVVPRRRAKKHPCAPKRPMSAFLKFSQKTRQTIKTENPNMSNTDVSKLLGELWRNATPQEKAPYREQELKERAAYKEQIKKFNEEQAKKDAASRTSHKTVQKIAAVDCPHVPPPSLPGRSNTYELRSSTFGAHHLDPVLADSGNRGEPKNYVFRHNFGGVPFSSYRPSVYPHHPPPCYHPSSAYHRSSNHSGNHHGSHHSSSGDCSSSNNNINNSSNHNNQSNSIQARTVEHLALVHGPLPPLGHHLDDDDDVLVGSYTNYFSDNMGFNNFHNNSHP